MKSIGILTDNVSELGEFIESNIMQVFSGYVNINRYYLNNIKLDQKIEDDILLVMSKERFIQARKYFNDASKMIIVNRTIKEDDLIKIFDIPLNSTVLLVNDTKETTFDTVSLLYKIGVKNLNIIPFEENETYEDINIAITPNLSSKVPEHIQKVVNIGNRHIDVSTFIEITDKLMLNNKSIKERLISYSKTIITLNRGISDNIRELYDKTEELETIFNLSNEGGILINCDNVILRHNIVFASMFDLEANYIGKHIKDIFSNTVLKIMESREFNQELVIIKEKTFLISKKETCNISKVKGSYINFQEITYIKKLEQVISNKNKNRGLVARYNFENIIAESDTMKKCISLAKKLAKSNNTVLITGESGTGKELLAQSIHNESDREKYPFVAVNCAAISESLLESELFGYEGGSFTGALKQGKAGYFELAHHGSIFLDEIGDMPISLQTRLLRVLQEKQVMRIGSSEVLNVDIRIILATNKDLNAMIKAGTFREDLYYRINVLPINIPPLRKRKDDIISIMKLFLENKDLQFDDGIEDMLINYRWQGNIRELENAVSYINVLDVDVLKVDYLPNYLLYSEEEFLELEKRIIQSDLHTYIFEFLEIIKTANDLNKGVGRNKIETELNRIDINISENEIRRMISELNTFRLLTSKKGRAGTILTSKGINYYNWLTNR